MDLAPLFGLLICVVALFFLCALSFAIYIFIRVLKARKRMKQAYDTFRRL